MAAPNSGNEQPLPTPPRFWTIEEANARLDGLREEMPRLRALALRMQKIQAEIQRLTAFWGKEIDSEDQPDRALHARLESEWKAVGEKLRAEIEALQAEGIVVKDLDTGLLDFYAYEAGEVVFLCWQLGEEKVGYYHTLEGGYRSRRPIGGLPRNSSTPSHHSPR